MWCCQWEGLKRQGRQECINSMCTAEARLLVRYWAPASAEGEEGRRALHRQGFLPNKFATQAFKYVTAVYQLWEDSGTLVGPGTRWKL